MCQPRERGLEFISPSLATRLTSLVASAPPARGVQVLEQKEALAGEAEELRAQLRALKAEAEQHAANARRHAAAQATRDEAAWAAPREQRS